MSGTILVTGAAGFIGSFLCKRLLGDGWNVVGLDNLNDYYDIGIKLNRLQVITESAGGGVDDIDVQGYSVNNFSFIFGDIIDIELLEELFRSFTPSYVVNLAAQAGVRYSIDNPRAYIDSNLIGFFNILECCRKYPVSHLVYASSSSVYGLNEKVPYSTEDMVDSPVSLYAATKKSNELMAHAYSKLYDIPVTGLRFFTVYGPMGRPDMAYFKFTNKIVKGEPIQIYNMGDMYRDFTYIDDIVEGIIRVIGKVPDPNESGVKYQLYNIGNNNPESLMHFVQTLEQILMEEKVVQSPAKHELLPMQPGDVYKTYADIAKLEKDFGYKPSTDLKEGLRSFVKWYKTYYEL